MKFIKWSAALLAVSLIFTSCKKDEPVECKDDSLDTKLATAIANATNVDGISSLKMPDSFDYDNIPQDPTNPLTAAKVELGKLLFHETALAVYAKYEEGNGTYSCASCHHAAAGFQANIKQGIGDGGVGFGNEGEGRIADPNYSLDSIDIQPIRTPTAMNGAYQKVMLWNGQFGATGPNEGTEALWPPGTPIWNNQFGHEGLEIQAIAGLSVHRMDCLPVMGDLMPEYAEMFDEAFPEVPEDMRMSIRFAGLAIAAYERTLLSNQSPWQDYLHGNTNALTDSEKRGAELFFNKANCSACHNGPALNSMTFQAIGMGNLDGPGTYGTDNSDSENLGRGGFTGEAADEYKFKVPQLYNLKDSPFYGHGGTFTDLQSLVEYKNEAMPENIAVPNSQLSQYFVPLNLTDEEVQDLVKFLEDALYDGDLMRYQPDETPSEHCIPNNDVQSQEDQGCIG